MHTSFVSPSNKRKTTMTNETTLTKNEIRHQMLDIEVDIDKKIGKRIQSIKDTYTTAIAEFKIVRSTDIKAVKAERKQMVADAYKKLTEA